jgi:hypothetical protein
MDARKMREFANRALTSARWNELPRGPFLPSLYPGPEPDLDLCRPTVRTSRPYPLIVHGTRVRRTMVGRSINNS